MDLYEKILGALAKYSKGSMLEDIYGLSEAADYDAVVIAPAWVPEKVFSRYQAVIIPKKRGAYFSGFEVGVQGKKLGWIQTSSSAGNVIDAMFTLAKSRCEKIIFLGAVGALKPESKLGEIVTPTCAISGDGGSLYLHEQLSGEYFLEEITQNPTDLRRLRTAAQKLGIPLQEGKVYCTDSITCEYFHMDKILSCGSDYIEMETAAFLRCLAMMKRKGNVLLCVSDNSSAGQHLMGRSEQEMTIYHRAREEFIPKLLLELLGD